MASPSQTVPPEGDAQSRSDHGISRASSVSSAGTGRTDQEATGPETHTNEHGEVDVDIEFKELQDAQLAVKVGKFADEQGLERQSELLKFGAQLAKDTKNALANLAGLSNMTNRVNEANEANEDLLILTKEQRDYLDEGEKQAGFWGQSKYLKGSLLSACLAGIVQGWTQSAMNGANIGISSEFGLHVGLNNTTPATGDLWVFGFLNAIPFLAGGLLAPLVSDSLQEHVLGRRGAIAVACLLSIAATIGQAFSQSIAQIAGCRVITGLTLAAKASTAPLLTAEMAPNHLRGNFLSTWQLSDAFGIFLGFSSNLAILHMASSYDIIWRVEIAAILIPTIILLFVVYLMPESPRFLMKQGRHPKALEAFTFVRPSPVARLLAARDLVYAHFQLDMECKSMNERQKHQKSSAKQTNPTGPTGPVEKKDVKVSEKNLGEPPNGQGEGDLESQMGLEGTKPKTLYDMSQTNYFIRLKQTFKDDRSRRALVCASTAMISQQLCGINTIAFLSGTLISTSDQSQSSGAWIGFGIGLCNFIFGTPAFWLLDRVGRSTLLLLGFVPMFILMLILAFSFDEHTDGTEHARVGLVGTFTFLFIIAYSPTAGTSPFAISAEVFPLVVREVGHSLAVAVNFLGLGLVLLVFPLLSDAMGGYRGSLSLFAVLNLVALVLVFLFVPETKGRTLEELRFIFDIPTKAHIKYRVTVVAPWLVKSYVPGLFSMLLAKLGRKKHPANALGGNQGGAEGEVQGVDEGLQGTDDMGLIQFHDWYKAIQ